MPLYLVLLPLAPLLSFVLTLLSGKWMGSRAHRLPILAAFVAFVCALIAAWQVGRGVVIDRNLYTWIEVAGFQAHFGFLVDQLTAAMLVVVTSISLLVHIYSVGYMRGDPGYARFFAYLSLFTFSMLMLVLGNNFLQLFFGWEAVGLSSYLLIGFWHHKKSAADAGKKAFIVNRFGDFGLSLGIMLVFLTFGTLDYQEVFQAAAGIVGQRFTLLGVTVELPTLIALLLFCGAVGKSAMIPLHVWLPDAMEGPTPVSALIHAATMVTAGVFLVARCNPLFELSAVALNVVTVVGALTCLFAATIALVQTDIKRVVAYSTVSQLSYMFVACGVGAYSAGIFHLFTHAYFKALLFLGCGSVIHAMGGEQDVRRMGGLRRYLPVTYWTFLLASLSISGVPGLAGFFSKDEILLMAYTTNIGSGRFAWFIGLVVAFITAFYSFRLFFLTFHGRFRGSEEERAHLHESPPVMTVPLALLAVGAVAAGWLGSPEILGGHSMWNNFMAPVLGRAEVEVPHATEWLLMGISVFAGLSGIWLAYHLYLRRPELPGRLRQSFGETYRWLWHKYYVDEFYTAVLVQPALNASRYLLAAFADQAIIEGVVNGVPRLIGRASIGLRRLQSGHVQQYLAVMASGAAGVLVWLYLAL